jgi:hypothetical protein
VTAVQVLSLKVAAAETALKAAPKVAFSGGELRYRLVAGKPTVYCVGKDLKDDGGEGGGTVGASAAGI